MKLHEVKSEPQNRRISNVDIGRVVSLTLCPFLVNENRFDKKAHDRPFDKKAHDRPNKFLRN